MRKPNILPNPDASGRSDMKNSFTSKVLHLHPSFRRCPLRLDLPPDRANPFFSAFPRVPPTCCIACTSELKLQSSPPKFPLIPAPSLSTPLAPKEPAIRPACVMLYIRARRRESKALLYTSSSSGSCRRPFSPHPAVFCLEEEDRQGC